MSTSAAIFAILVAGAFAGVPKQVKIDVNGSWRVVGGSPAPDGEYPHQISLRSFGSHSCGGSILNEEWVVTAAHCVEGGSPAYWSVVVGSNHLNSGGQEFEVEDAFYHEDYDSWLIQNDIGLIKLKGKITFSDKVQPIALETQDVAGQEDCVLCGWGTTSYPGSIPNDLQHINLKTTSVQECQAAHFNPVFESEICTLTEEGEGACHGDSGGALMRTVDSVRRLIGIVSWGSPCARGSPDVYTRVSSFVDWISKHCSACAKTV